MRGLDSGQADEKMALGNNDLVRMANEHTPAVRQADPQRFKGLSPQKLGDPPGAHSAALYECFFPRANSSRRVLLADDRSANVTGRKRRRSTPRADDASAGATRSWRQLVA